MTVSWVYSSALTVSWVCSACAWYQKLLSYLCKMLTLRSCSAAKVVSYRKSVTATN
jgi:hypothetical protein